MSLRYQIASLLVVLSMLLVATTYAVQSWVVMPAFEALEEENAKRDVERCIQAIEHDIEGISNTAHDWASWDDSYQYVQDHNETFAKGNLINESFGNTHLNLICILDTKCQLVWGEARDFETLQPIEVPDLLALLQQENNKITTFHNKDDVRKGILLTSQGPLLFASRPMLTTKHEGPIQGAVVMGRFFSAKEIVHLAQRTEVSLDCWVIGESEMSDDNQRALAACSAPGRKFIERVDATSLNAFSVLNDIHGKPALLIRLQVPRDITQQGSVSANAATACGILGSLCILVAMWCVLKWRIISPLQQMADHALRVGQLDDLKARLNFARRDEMGVLAGQFDVMVLNLAETRKKVLDSAHRAGMAEIASEVLHNVGNAVNSANCSVESLEERINNSKIAGLDRAATLLREHASQAGAFFSQDPRGPKLIQYLLSLNETLRQERIDNQAEVVRLRDTVRHIHEAIATQQNFAGRSDFRQEVELPAFIDNILQMNQELIRAAEVKVVVDLPALPELQLNKSKMTQVLVNLVRNAVQAMQLQSSDNRQLTILVRCIEEESIEIEVRDTGIGFEDAVREKLFTHGFTTKPEGNGFGLHYCANAVREVGGHISAISGGIGQGASFKIRLPHVFPAAMATP